MRIAELPAELRDALRKGMVIPAHPLALNEHRQLDLRRQRALTRYYVEAGAGGLAVGVHTTQFAIRQPAVGLLDTVLTLASQTMDDWGARRGRTLLKVAGICGLTDQAVGEAGWPSSEVTTRDCSAWPPGHPPAPISSSTIARRSPA
jgi:hypothetical protein